MTMTEPTRIFTVGPVDPNAGMRGELYAGLALVIPTLSFLATLGIFTADQVNAVSGFLTAAVGLLGTFGFGLAAAKTNKQVRNGTFEAAPAPEPTPVLDAFQAVDAIKTHVDQVVDHAQSKVSEGVAAIQGAASLLPGGTFVNAAMMAGPVGDLLRAVTAVNDNDARN